MGIGRSQTELVSDLQAQQGAKVWSRSCAWLEPFLSLFEGACLLLHEWKINGLSFTCFCDEKEALPLMTLRIGFTVIWPQMVFVVPTHPVTICFLNLNGYCHTDCYRKAEGRWWSSSSKLIFLRKIYLPRVQHLSKGKEKKKKQPWHETETGCECILPVCLRWDDFLQLITDVSGEVEKQISIAGLSLVCGSIIWQVQKYHIQLRFSHLSAKPLLHLFSNSSRSCILQQAPTDRFVHNPPSQCSSGVAPSLIDELVVFSSSWQSTASAPWPLAQGCL